MTIGIVTTWFERGAAYVSRQYMRSLEAAGHEVRIYARGGEVQARNDPAWDGPHVTWAAVPQAPWDGTALDRHDFEAWLKREKIAVVIFNEQHWWLAVLWAKDMGLPCVAYIDYYTEETVPFFAVYDILFCNTLRHQSAFSWHAGCRYIPWGTDTSMFFPRKKPRECSEKVVFFHSAGMNPYRKGTDLVLDAYAETCGETHLFIHSQQNLREYFPSHAELIDMLQNQGRLTIHHGDVHAPGLYNYGDVYVYPARLDGLGLTQCEALACGLPIIVPDCSPMNEFATLVSGTTVPVVKQWSRADGYYWPQCEVSVEGLAQAMQRYVDDVDMLERKKEMTREYAVAKRDWDQNARCIKEMVANISCAPVSNSIRYNILAYYHGRANFDQSLFMKSPRMWKTVQLLRRIKKRLKAITMPPKKDG